MEELLGSVAERPTESIRRFYRPLDEAKFPAVLSHIVAMSPNSSRLR